MRENDSLDREWATHGLERGRTHGQGNQEAAAPGLDAWNWGEGAMFM